MTLYDRGAFEQAHVRLRSAPGELTMADVEQLATFGGADLGREALAARKAALFPAPAVPAPAQAVNRGGLSEASIDAIAEGVVTFLAEHIRPILARLRAIAGPRQGRGQRALARRVQAGRTLSLGRAGDAPWVALGVPA